MSTTLFGAVEAGGTKFRCAVSDRSDGLRAVATIPTTSPGDTLGAVATFFASQARGLHIRGLGIASFGPVDLRLGSKTYGYITTTPKPGWRDVNIVGRLTDAIGPDVVAFETDVTAAAVGEHQWGAGRGVSTLAYVTVGTGIGAGLVVNGQPAHGLVHPEFGHIRVPHDMANDPFPGSCVIHGDCLEGLASGRAIFERWHVEGADLDEGHPAWALETQYLALGLLNLICIVSPERIVLGGGVAKRLPWPALRAQVGELLAGYLAVPELTVDLDEYIVPPAHGDNAGLIGALTMAERALACSAGSLPAPA